MAIDVIHNPAASRFETRVDGALCVADYRMAGRELQMTHTEVSPPLRGRGIAAALVAAALEHAQAEGLQVRPLCSYVRTYMRRHPPTLALLAP